MSNNISHLGFQEVYSNPTGYFLCNSHESFIIPELPHVELFYSRRDDSKFEYMRMVNYITGSDLRCKTTDRFEDAAEEMLLDFDKSIRGFGMWYDNWLTQRHKKATTAAPNAVYAYEYDRAWLRCFEDMKAMPLFKWHPDAWNRHPLVFDWWSEPFKEKYPEVELELFFEGLDYKYNEWSYNQMHNDLMEWLRNSDLTDAIWKMYELQEHYAQPMYLNAVNAPHLFNQLCK